MANQFHLDGAVDVGRFVAAFDRVVDHSDVLRLRIEAADSSDGSDIAAASGIVGQRIGHATTVIDVALDDVDAWADDRITATIDATSQVYDSVLLRHEDGTTTWWLGLHHVATDAWSSVLVFEATAAVYARSDDDTFDDTFDLDTFDLDTVIDGAYFEVAVTQQGRDEPSAPAEPVHGAGPRSDRMALYGPSSPPVTDLSRVDLPLDDATAIALRTATEQRYRSLSADMSLLAVAAMSTALLVHRLDGRTTVDLDVPVHHRSARRFRRLVGPMMELSSLSVEIRPDDTHLVMFKRVVRSIMELLNAAERGARVSQRSGLVVNVITARSEDFAGIPARRRWVRAPHADHGLLVGSQLYQLTPPDGTGPPRLAWEVEVNAAVGDAASVDRLPHHLAAIVAGIIDRPDALASATPIVMGDELAELQSLNPAPPSRPLRPIHEVIAAQLRDRPEWVVAEHDGEQITAAAFDRRADEVAAWLQQQGVMSGHRVAIRLPRSIDVLIAIQAVLRSGASFVFLDPDDPPARHDAIVADAGISVVIDGLPGPEMSGRYPSQAAQVGLDDEAYVLFTSGSTGAPKGVPISHRGLADYLDFAVTSYGLDSPTVALHSSLVFDLTITSLFIGFLTAGRTVIFDLGPVEALAAIAADDRIDTLKATPSQLEIYCRLATPGRPLATVIVGGEAFRRPVASRLVDICSTGVRIFNEYGPTEAVVGCMLHELDLERDVAADVPIGGAAPGAAVALLDAGQQLTPVGAWGELYVRRDGMARSYIARPEETEHHFVSPDALQAVAPGPWYRTGDRARIVAPATLVYGGRRDDQLKVSGIRLEPAEVEAALVSHPLVVSSLVRQWRAPDGADLLTAWYRTESGDALDVDDLRAHLRRSLADHAIPAAFVMVDDMPLAASAKADPSQLPAPGIEHRVGQDRAAPSTPSEEVIAAIWSQVLDVRDIGVTDDFFSVGGASLSSIEVVAIIDEHFGTRLEDAAVFTARTVRDLAALVDEQIASGAEAGGGSAHRRIGPLAPGTPLPLSSSEEAMLFDYRRTPSSTHYNVARLYSLELDAPLDMSRLRAAVVEVVADHETLHTSYGPGRPELDVDQALAWTEHAPMSVAAFDLLAASSRAMPFDLDAGPLIRVDVARTGADHWSLLICLHHISLGVGTLDLIWNEVVDRYDGRVPSEQLVTYGAHVAWQRGRSDAAAREFWLDRSRRRTEPAPLALQPPLGADSDGHVSDGYVVKRTSKLAADLAVSGYTPFTSALAAAAIAITRFTASRRVEFGIAASTKDHPAAARLIGHHLNSLPIPMEVDGQATFRDILEQAFDTMTDALGVRTYPFASMVRDARAAGLVPPDLAFMLAYDEMGAARFPGGRVEHRILPSDVAVTDVTLFVQERPDSVRLAVEYRGSVLSAADATRLLDLFETVLLAGVEQPTSSVAELTASEAGQIVRGPQSSWPAESVLGRIVDTARTDPDSPALMDAGGDIVSRGELLWRVSGLVDAIEQCPVPARRIGVAVGRGNAVVPALLAAQLAGAAVVPLDPTAGEQRLQAIVDATELEILLVDQTLERAPDGSILGVPNDRCIDVASLGKADRDSSSRADDVTRAADRLRQRCLALGTDDVAYIVFTSGSTGTPRGVEVTHHNLAASTFARAPWYGEAPGRFLVTSSIGFDSSVVGVYWPLVDGGVVVMPDDDDVHDVDRIAALIDDRGITTTLMVPTLYRAILDRSAGSLSGVRTAIVAGEACPVALARDHARLLPGVALVNEYGPTEATVWATAHRVERDDDPVPIGRPVPGVELVIVSADLQPVPDGVAGELWIGGAGVTPGYLDDSAATSERFVDRWEQRWYRTGDRVRSVDARIEFVGRFDDQLNVGGVRVEPVEIERLIRGVAEIDDVVVVAAGSPVALVAHLTSTVSVDEAALRDHLADRLPGGAVPRRFIRHAALPMTPNGKIDRRAAAELGVPDVTIDAPDDAAEGPLSSLEQTVLTAWRRALRRGDVSSDTDFFTTGGDSLAAVEIVTSVGATLGSRVPIATLLTGRTPRGMAGLLERDRVGLDVEAGVGAGAGRSVHDGVALLDACHAVTLRTGRVGGPMLLLVPAWDDVFGYQALAEAFDDDVTAVALVHTAQPGVAPIMTVDELVAALLPIATNVIDGRGNVAVVGWSVGGIVAVELAEALTAAGQSPQYLVLVDTLFPGEDRHLWSNRWWKYKSMLVPGSIKPAISEFATMAGRRIRGHARKLASRVGLRPPAASTTAGEATLAPGEFPPESLSHEVGPIGLPLVYYAATGTNPERTIVKWAELAADMVTITIPGRHRGVDSVMGSPGVHAIASDLSARLH